MLNQGISTERLSTPDFSGPDRTSQPILGAGQLTSLKPRLQRKAEPDRVKHTGEQLRPHWQQFKHSAVFLPAVYMLLIAGLSTTVLLLYSQLVYLSRFNAQMLEHGILLGLWVAIIASSAMLLGRLKALQLERRYAPFKPLALQTWSQLNELGEFIGRVQKICQGHEQPPRTTLIKCLDNYYENSVSFNKELQKIQLFLNDAHFDQLISSYQLTGKCFRDKLADLIGELSVSASESGQDPCSLILDTLTPLCRALEQYHQAIAQQLTKIIRA